MPINCLPSEDGPKQTDRLNTPLGPTSTSKAPFTRLPPELHLIISSFGILPLETFHALQRTSRILYSMYSPNLNQFYLENLPPLLHQRIKLGLFKKPNTAGSGRRSHQKKLTKRERLQLKRCPSIPPLVANRIRTTAQFYPSERLYTILCSHGCRGLERFIALWDAANYDITPGTLSYYSEAMDYINNVAHCKHSLFLEAIRRVGSSPPDKHEQAFALLKILTEQFKPKFIKTCYLSASTASICNYTSEHWEAIGAAIADSQSVVCARLILEHFRGPFIREFNGRYRVLAKACEAGNVELVKFWLFEVKIHIRNRHDDLSDTTSSSSSSVSDSEISEESSAPSPSVREENRWEEWAKLQRERNWQYIEERIMGYALQATLKIPQDFAGGTHSDPSEEQPVENLWSEENEVADLVARKTEILKIITAIRNGWFSTGTRRVYSWREYNGWDSYKGYEDMHVMTTTPIDALLCSASFEFNSSNRISKSIDNDNAALRNRYTWKLIEGILRAVIFETKVLTNLRQIGERERSEICRWILTFPVREGAYRKEREYALPIIELLAHIGLYPLADLDEARRGWKRGREKLKEAKRAAAHMGGRDMDDDTFYRRGSHSAYMKLIAGKWGPLWKEVERLCEVGRRREVTVRWDLSESCSCCKQEPPDVFPKGQIK